jgi:catecholate siderophore receptor
MSGRTPIAASLLAVLLAPSAALAETPSAAAAPDAGALKEVSAVVVTGRSGIGSFGADGNAIDKLPQDLHDIPQSVTVVNKALMRSTGATSLADAPSGSRAWCATRAAAPCSSTWTGRSSA